MPRALLRPFLRGAGLICVACSTTLAQAKANGPVFLLQPGVQTADFISAPPDQRSSSGFILRFATILTTPQRWVRPVFGASVTPFGASGYTNRNINAPVLFVGNAFPSIGNGVSGGWVRAEGSLLWYYSYGGGGARNRQLYGRDVYLQLAVHLPVGERVLSDLGAFWKGLELFALLDQNLTPNAEPATGGRDYFNPIASYGVTLRFSPRQ
jgi:hypothetical protein